jgi:hypothetical protein
MAEFEEELIKLNDAIKTDPELKKDPLKLIDWLNENDKNKDSILTFLLTNIIPNTNEEAVVLDDNISDYEFEEEINRLGEEIKKTNYDLAKDPSKLLEWLKQNPKILSILKKHLKTKGSEAEINKQYDDTIPKFESEEELKSWLKQHPCLIKSMGMSSMPSMDPKELINKLFNNCFISSIFSILLSPSAYQDYKELGERLKNDSDKIDLSELNITGELMSIVAFSVIGTIPFVGTGIASFKNNATNFINGTLLKVNRKLDKLEKQIDSEKEKLAHQTEAIKEGIPPQIKGGSNKTRHRHKHKHHKSINEFHKTKTRRVKSILHGGPF